MEPTRPRFRAYDEVVGVKTSFTGRNGNGDDEVATSFLSPKPFPTRQTKARTWAQPSPGGKHETPLSALTLDFGPRPIGSTPGFKLSHYGTLESPPSPLSLHLLVSRTGTISSSSEAYCKEQTRQWVYDASQTLNAENGIPK